MPRKKENMIKEYIESQDDYIQLILKQFFEDQENFKLFNRVKHVLKFFNVDSIEFLYKKINDINKLGRDSSSLKSFQIRYGNELGNKKFKEKNKKCTIIVDNYIKKYGEKGKELYRKSRVVNNFDILVERHGKEEAEKRIKKYRETYSRSNSLNGYIDKHGEENGIKLWEKRLKKSSRAKTLERYKEIYGEEEGIKKYNLKSHRFLKSSSLIGYIEKYGLEEGKKNWKKYCENRKTLTIEKFKNLYGEDGTEKLDKIKKGISFSNTLNGFIKRYGKENGEKKYKSYITKLQKVSFKRSYSYISQKLFDLLDIDDSKYYTNGEELCISYENGVYFYDFVYKNKIIEFNGDFWHANPEFYDKNDMICDIPVSNIWEKDLHKKLIAQNNGYDILVIWENEFINNKEKIIEKCKTFLNM